MNLSSKMTNSLKRIKIPERYNYIACFLTLDCNLQCNYCINYFGGIKPPNKKMLSGEEWVGMLNRLDSPLDLPVTLQGGEPSLHPDFIWIIKNIKTDLNIDILTNLQFNIEEFIKEIHPARLNRKAPYPNIRVSYHPGYMDLEQLIGKVIKMQKAGFSMGIFSILHPLFETEVRQVQKYCRGLGIDFRTKEFLGVFRGKLYGTYRYPDAVANSEHRKCLCRWSELIISPEGNIFRCHHDLYCGLPSLGNLQDSGFEIQDIFRECVEFGSCNPCDIKIKTNRFQVDGHTSVEIKKIVKIPK